MLRIDRDSLLLVEDDEEQRALFASALEERGFKVVTAGDGAEAMDALSWLPVLPCLLVCDWRMPRMDGREFLERLDAHGVLAAVPVLVITGDVSADPRGAAAVLRKPFEVSEFVEAVELHAAD